MEATTVQDATTAPDPPAEVLLKIVVMGSAQAGKTTLINSLRSKPIRITGAEGVAGYCISNDRMQISLSLADGKSKKETVYQI
jgi:GTPase SAR1 family protein